MNYISFIIKVLNKPQFKYNENIPCTEALGKFYQFRNNSHTICKLSFWGRPAYEILKYSRKNDYFIVEGYLSLRPSSFKKFNIDTNIEISIFKVYPLPIQPQQIKK